MNPQDEKNKPQNDNNPYESGEQDPQDDLKNQFKIHHNQGKAQGANDERKKMDNFLAAMESLDNIDEETFNSIGKQIYGNVWAKSKTVLEKLLPYLQLRTKQEGDKGQNNSENSEIKALRESLQDSKKKIKDLQEELNKTKQTYETENKTILVRSELTALANEIGGLTAGGAYFAIQHYLNSRNFEISDNGKGEKQITPLYKTGSNAGEYVIGEFGHADLREDFNTFCMTDPKVKDLIFVNPALANSPGAGFSTTRRKSQSSIKNINSLEDYQKQRPTIYDTLEKRPGVSVQGNNLKFTQ